MEISRSLAPRRALAVVAVILVAFALAGCDTISRFATTVNKLKAAGFANPQLDMQSGGSTDVVELRYRARSVDPETLRAEEEQAARIIWQEFPFRFDQLDVHAESDQGVASTESWERAELEQLFGPRPAGLDQDPASLFRNTLHTALLWGSVALVAFLAAVALIIILVVRANRRRRQAQAAYAGWPGQAGAPAQGWGQPPPGYPPPPSAPPQGQPPPPPPGQADR